MSFSNSVRFFVGLHSSTDRASSGLSIAAAVESRADRVVAALSLWYPNGLTVVRGSGVWRGAVEPNILIEAIVDGEMGPVSDQARNIAGEIALAFGQECVAVTVERVDFLLAKVADADVRRPISDARLAEIMGDASSPLTDSGALDTIADALDGQEWNADAFEIIANAVRRSGRTIGDLR